MNTKPNWVPNNFWEKDYLQHEIYGASPFGKEQLLFLFSKPELADFWQRLNRRELHNKSGDSWETFGKAAVLADVIYSIRSEYKGSSLLSNSARAALSLKLKKDVDSLLSTIDEIRNGDGGMPTGVSERTEHYYKELQSETGLSFSRKYLAEQYGEHYAADDAQDVFLGIMLEENLPNFLNNLCDATKGWATEEDAYLSKPSHKNAERLYFIRRLSYMFRYWYGKPCRGDVLAMAGVYWDCDDLDEAAISTLAPVRMLDKMSR